MTDIESNTSEVVPRESLVNLTHVMYGLHAFSALMGLLGPMFIVTAFLTWPSIIAVIINYVKRSEVRGTYLDSHFGWQLKTFWIAVLLVVIAVVLVLTIIGIPLAWLMAVATGAWILYRVIRGWIALKNGAPIPR